MMSRSRVARKPIDIPKGVDVLLKDGVITVKGKNGELQYTIPANVSVIVSEQQLLVSANDETVSANALAGTSRARINNMVVGVDRLFEKKLQLVGVGYRAQLKGKVLNLTLGYSHPIDHIIPEGVMIEVPSQTEITVKSADKQLVGQVAADIRSYRQPEPYKGKGIRYVDEIIKRKEAKKK